MTSPLPISTDFDRRCEENRAAVLAEACKAKNPRKVYAMIHGFFLDETQIALPLPPFAAVTNGKFWRARGAAYLRLPLLEQWDIILKFYNWLRSITPEFKSDLNSVPKLFTWLFPWPNLLALNIQALVHDWFYYLARTFKLWLVRGFRLLVDKLYRDQILEMGSFAPLPAKPFYWAIASWRYATLRLFGEASFRHEEMTA